MCFWFVFLFFALIFLGGGLIFQGLPHQNGEFPLCQRAPLVVLRNPWVVLLATQLNNNNKRTRGSPPHRRRDRDDAPRVCDIVRHTDDDDDDDDNETTTTQDGRRRTGNSVALALCALPSELHLRVLEPGRARRAGRELVLPGEGPDAGRDVGVASAADPAAAAAATAASAGAARDRGADAV